MSRIRFKYLFHGTSSLYRADIEKAGLLPVNGLLHLTTHPLVALMEAEWTVSGEPHLKAGYKKGVGGGRLVVLVERAEARNLQIDTPGYYDNESAKWRRLSQVRVGFRWRKYRNQAKNASRFLILTLRKSAMTFLTKSNG